MPHTHSVCTLQCPPLSLTHRLLLLCCVCCLFTQIAQTAEALAAMEAKLLTQHDEIEKKKKDLDSRRKSVLTKKTEVRRERQPNAQHTITLSPQTIFLCTLSGGGVGGGGEEGGGGRQST